MTFQSEGGGGGSSSAGTAPFSITGAAGAVTALMVNPSTASGLLLDLQLNSGGSLFKVDSIGTVTAQRITLISSLSVPTSGLSITPGGNGGLALNWNQTGPVVEVVGVSSISNANDWPLFRTGSMTRTLTGAVATQRWNVFQQPTETGAFTVTTDATVAIVGPPIAAGGATLTNPMALWVQSGMAQLDGRFLVTNAGVGRIFEAVAGSINVNYNTGAAGLVTNWYGGGGTTITTSITASGTFSTANKVYPGQDTGATQAVCGLYAGTGLPAAGNGANGDFYFRGDTPGTVNQRLYQKSAGAWVALAL